jgi:hypothetical protein
VKHRYSDAYKAAHRAKHLLTVGASALRLPGPTGDVVVVRKLARPPDAIRQEPEAPESYFSRWTDRERDELTRLCRSALAIFRAGAQ